MLPPIGITAGDRISYDDWMKMHGIDLIRTDSDELCDTIRRIGVQENAPHGECVSVVLEQMPACQLVCVIWEPTYIHVEYRTPGDKERYRGRYIRSEWRDYYFFSTEELAYQRESLKPNGWKLLPRGYCDNKALIAHLVRRGGLSQNFVKMWEDGRTVFNAWR